MYLFRSSTALDNVCRSTQSGLTRCGGVFSAP